MQTNEPGRASLLYPSVSLACSEAEEPVALLEVGSSAGLLLAFDRYTVDYTLAGGAHRIAGPAAGRVRLACTSDRKASQDFDVSVQIAERVGIDRNPIAPADPDGHRWLRACIWADQPGRLHDLNRAIVVRAEIDAEIVIGDGASRLPQALAAVPLHRPLVVITSWSLTFMDHVQRTDLLAGLASAATRRRLWWIDNGPYEDGPAHVHGARPRMDFWTDHQTTLTLTTWEQGAPRLRVLGRSDPFGHRLSWIFCVPGIHP